MASLDQGKKFSKIDLRQAYFQLPLTDKSKHRTTINTSKGLYVFNRLVFGITSAPAIWQKTMDKILQGLPGVLCNQDDMIISGKTDQEHHDNLYRVLQRLEEHGLRANYEKCNFYQDQVVFCGIKVTKDGLHKTSDKIKAIQYAPIPCKKTQLRSFLGLVNYYHKWIDCQTTLRPTPRQRSIPMVEISFQLH
ncbi:Pol polyprotein [Elysia marginata]|uniref:Pol polyprotein n=1 Tax=Elysia marginata TaxID=1093978 RepID=A0AAV4I9Y3_9GAST|nr:Pol polyprotein [Elysia marginata]